MEAQVSNAVRALLAKVERKARQELMKAQRWAAASASEDDRAVAAAEATVAQRRAVRQPASRYVGVTWAKRRWIAYITHEGRLHRLGQFAVEEVAARAYDLAARRLQAHHANGYCWRLNFPTEAEAAATSRYQVAATVPGGQTMALRVHSQGALMNVVVPPSVAVGQWFVFVADEQFQGPV